MHFTQSTVVILGFPGGSDGKESACNAGDSGLTPRSGRSPGERNGYPFLPGESHGQKSLVSYSPWGRKQSDRTERLTLSLCTFTVIRGHGCRQCLLLLLLLGRFSCVRLCVTPQMAALAHKTLSICQYHLFSPAERCYYKPRCDFSPVMLSLHIFLPPPWALSLICIWSVRVQSGKEKPHCLFWQRN